MENRIFCVDVRQSEFLRNSAYCNRLEQYARAPAISASVIVDGCRVGVVYGVVA